jgi:hypothetical protein
VTAATATALAGATALAAGCGSRTGLLVDDAPPAAEAGEAGGRTFPIYALVPTQASGEGTYNYSLSRFDPASATFGALEPIPCLKAFGDLAVSMAVGCDGAAYVQFTRSAVWRVTTSPADCGATSFNPAAQAFDPDLQLAFTRSATAEGETLFFVGTDASQGAAELGTIDTQALIARRIAPFGFGAADQTHLGGSPGGQLYAVTQGAIDVLDLSTGAGTQAATLPLPTPHWATQTFAFYQGSFYFFDIVPGPETTSVMRFTIGDKQATHVADTTWTIVAASAPPCP